MQFRSKGGDDARPPTSTKAVRGAIVLGLAVGAGLLVATQISSSGPVAIDPNAAPTTTVGANSLLDPDPAGAAADPNAQTDSALDGTATDGTATDGTASAGDDAMTDGSTGDAMTDGTTDSTTGDTTTGDTTVGDTAPGPRSPDQVTVLVLNGAEAQGIATKGTDVVKGAGYRTMVARNANAVQPSAVLFLPGYEQEAAGVTEAFGPGLEGLIRAFDPASPPADAGEYEEANVIVVLGNDGLIPVS